MSPYLVSSATSTSALAVIGALECTAVGSSVFSSPLVELITWRRRMEDRGMRTVEPTSYPGGTLKDLHYVHIKADKSGSTVNDLPD